MLEDFNLLNGIFKQLFGDPLPAWLTLGLVVVVFFWYALKFLPKLGGAINDARKAILEQFVPLFYNPTKRAAAAERRQFAEALYQRLATLNTQEDFSDEQFAELEAEVEVRGVGSRRDVWRWLLGRDKRPRRVASLSAALKVGTARIILLEGEPGSGKSTALRHVALLLAERAKTARGLSSVLPVYVNFREFPPAENAEITHDAIRKHVIWVLLGANTADQANQDTRVYIEREFENNLKSGRWLFLFDSFDEAPAVLRSPDFEPIVKKLGTAIREFLEMSPCTAVVASRPYPALNQFGWTRFRILPLSPSRRVMLISRSGLTRQKEQQLREWLGSESNTRLAEMTYNPMYVHLLCRYWQGTPELPTSAFQVYEAYFDRRFRHDAARLAARGVTEEDAREVAKLIAYCLSADSTLGQSCPIEQLKAAVRGVVRRIPAHFEDRLAVLRNARLLGTVGDENSGIVRFEQPWFQEYFATEYLLDYPTAIEPRILLTDRRWREATVVLLQRRVGDSVSRLFTAAQELLTEEFRSQPQAALGGLPEAPPRASVYALNLLADGHVHQGDEVRVRLRALVNEIFINAWRTGRTSEIKPALELLQRVDDSTYRSLSQLLIPISTDHPPLSQKFSLSVIIITIVIVCIVILINKIIMN